MIKKERQRREEGRRKREDQEVAIFSERNSNIFFCYFFILSSLFFSFSSLVHASATRSDLPECVCFRGQCLNVEIADTDEERMRGLQNRKSLAEGQGMLFIFPSENVYRFWMKETLISLDMIWLDKQRKIVGFQMDAPPCREDPCPEYGPTENALYVLEADAGYIASHHLKIGDQAVFK